MKRLFTLLTGVTLAAGAYANYQVTGVVLSAEDGEPLVGASVMVPGTSTGTSTDIDGKFTLSVPDNVKTLRASYVGTKPVDFSVAPNSGEVSVSLQESSTLQEVVVTGYGTVSKQAFTGASSVVSGADIDKKSDVNFVKGLEGNVTGFQYNNSTAMPGTWGSVTVRGVGSLSSSSQPLYVIDGVPVSSTPDGLYDDSNNLFDPMAAYNPNDIESVTVLKDAAATAIYGSRAANGVIVITTKKGADAKFRLNIDVKQGFTSVANNNMKYADAATSLKLFARGWMPYSGMSYDESYEYLRDEWFYWDGITDTNWIDQVTRKGYYQDYNVNFSGTSGQTNYYVSLGYTDTEGIVINSGNKRYSGRVNLDTSYNFFSGGLSASFSYNDNRNFSNATTGSMSSPITAAVSSMTPFDPVYNPDSTYANIMYYNPVALNDEKIGDLSQVINQTFVANPWLQVNLPFGFSVKTNFGVNIIDQSDYQYWSAVTNPQGMEYNGLGQKYTTRMSTLTWTNTINWNKSFNDIHQFNVLLGQEMQRFETHYDYYARYDYPFADEGRRDFSTSAAPLDSGYGQEQSRLASYFADARYSLMDRYFFSASYRRDGSSVFGANHRWGNFWSLGAKWRLSEESFLIDQTWLSNADIRISYGTVGNQTLPSLYAARGYYQTGYNYNNSPGMSPAQIANDELTWETSRKFDVGFDFGIFNRANLTFDFYSEDTADALYTVPVSMTTGVASVYKNIGKIRNVGVEVGLNGVVYTNRDLTISLFGNLSWNKNKVLKLADGSIEGTYSIIDEGSPYRQFYMPEYAGVNPENGMAQYYKNETGDELTENYSEAAKRRVGSAFPKVFGAFGLNARGYGFDLSAQFNYRAGNKVYDTGSRFTGFGMDFRTPLQVVADNSWTPENTSAKYPQYIFSDPNRSVTGNYSTRWLMNGGFLRLSNITLGYTLPQNLTRKALMEKVRFYVSADNIHTWVASDFIGYNPETYENGVIAWQTPAVFTFTGGVQVTF